MSEAVPTFPPYVFMAWGFMKVQLYVYLIITVVYHTFKIPSTLSSLPRQLTRVRLFLWNPKAHRHYHTSATGPYHEPVLSSHIITP